MCSKPTPAQARRALVARPAARRRGAGVGAAHDAPLGGELCVAACGMRGFLDVPVSYLLWRGRPRYSGGGCSALMKLP